ncbi:MAG: nicotinate-nucleotide adenylyltransferase [Planctomycetaceae bacterium]|jgi:nicotinate-nucleotide adenylyltransferase
MRLGLFGGTFDPVHFGHLLLAERCREECRLDEVVFLPAGRPPHKQGQPITSGADRAAMLELAIAGQSRFRVDRRELSKPTPSFTVETLREFRREMPTTELVFLMGADSLADFPQWREPQEILGLAEVAVVGRYGSPAADLAAYRQLWGNRLVDRICQVQIPRIEFASREIRGRVAAGQSIRFMTPRAVECYIEQRRLYRSSE